VAHSSAWEREIPFDLKSIQSTFNEQLLRQYFGAKKLQREHLSFVIFSAKILYEKHTSKMLMK